DAAAGQVRAHSVQIDSRNVLNIEHASSGANGPSVARAPGDTEPRCKILIVGINSPIAESPVSGNIDARSVPEGNVLVKVPLANAHQGGVQGGVRHIYGAGGRLQGERK